MAVTNFIPVAERPDRERVVVTGMGVIAPGGNNLDSFWRSLLSGQSNARLIDRFDPKDLACQFACHVEGFDINQWMEDKRMARRLDRFVQFAVAAARQAVCDSNMERETGFLDQCGVLIGSGIGGMRTYEDQCEVILSQGPSRVSPFFVPMMISNMASGMVSILTGARGPNMGIVSACSTGAHAIGEAAWMIRRGDADAMLAGGTEAAITPLSIAGFSAARALSTRNDDPQRASRPFDRERDGFVIGEGAGVLMLESLAVAKKRRAPIHAEIAGYGLSADAFHITSPPPGGEGAVRAMRGALQSAGLGPEQVGYINAHGTSTPANDKTETAAIKAVFGEHSHNLQISSTKSVTGHLLGAAGGIEAIASVMALREQVVPPTINYQFPDPECDLDYVPNEARRVRGLEAALSNSFGFGGQNACLVMVRYNDA